MQANELQMHDSHTITYAGQRGTHGTDGWTDGRKGGEERGSPSHTQPGVTLQINRVMRTAETCSSNSEARPVNSSPAFPVPASPTNLRKDPMRHQH